MFKKFEDFSIVLNEAAEKAKPVSEVKAGDVVLVNEDEICKDFLLDSFPLISSDAGYRGQVTQVNSVENSAELSLVDMAVKAKKPISSLKVAAAELLESFPVQSVFCCLHSWVGEDCRAAKLEWGDKTEEILKPFKEFSAEVIETGDTGAGTPTIIKMPVVESKLGRKVLSRADMLKLKLKGK